MEWESVLVWDFGHVGIRGNSAADSAAKDALDGDIINYKNKPKPCRDDC